VEGKRVREFECSSFLVIWFVPEFSAIPSNCSALALLGLGRWVGVGGPESEREMKKIKKND
jgi:hypothetical protein